MPFIIFVFVSMILYISSFKDEFESEHVSKALGFVVLIFVVLMILNILIESISR